MTVLLLEIWHFYLIFECKMHYVPPLYPALACVCTIAYQPVFSGTTPLVTDSKKLDWWQKLMNCLLQCHVYLNFWMYHALSRTTWSCPYLCLHYWICCSRCQPLFFTVCLLFIYNNFCTIFSSCTVSTLHLSFGELSQSRYSMYLYMDNDNKYLFYSILLHSFLLEE